MNVSCDRCGKGLFAARVGDLCPECNAWLNKACPSVTPLKYPQPAASAWRTDEPPRDGTWFIARTTAKKIVYMQWNDINQIFTYFDAGGMATVPIWCIIAWAEINPYEVTP